MVSQNGRQRNVLVQNELKILKNDVRCEREAQNLRKEISEVRKVVDINRKCHL